MATGDHLVANKGQSFQGSNVLGKGFIVTPEQAHDLIQRDPRNKDVLFPYLNGEDLNSRPDCSASRWVINFHDWSEERARGYPEVFAIIERDVKPERLKNTNRQRREIWWRFTRPAMDLYRAISNLDRVLVVARVSRTAMATIVPTGQVLNEKIVLFASDRVDVMALLNSSIHVLWAWKYSATLKSDLQYTPSDCFETFPMPQHLLLLESPGKNLSETRTVIMRNRECGLTKLYNLVNDPQVSASDISELRECHKAVDEAVAEAYEWGDLDLGHGFHETRNGVRFTVAPVAQNEILDRLLELNHTRFNREADAASRERLEKSLMRDSEGVVALHGDTLF
ncbi:type IIL restriction-modification enzyme MmeI [Streptomyces sp. MBT59]|uniref:type IIL restriction-modification enzyme MmeI n=1 Tax=Streptomyces sp. MBT59 TaxID=1488390 RepID=UPI001913C27F|nr:type IIL restriction-modification enzyme MmeI [Streptomyces sp. MBT59]MBK6028347.1 hypothetical protein [Streptomyces sp. MBT59]